MPVLNIVPSLLAVMLVGTRPSMGKQEYGSVPVFKFSLQSSSTTDSMLTTSQNYVDNHYQNQGIIGYVFQNNETGTQPLHRYFSQQDSDHFYTNNWSELGPGKGNYIYEGILGYVYPFSTNGTIRLYRAYNLGFYDHLYTTDLIESRTKQFRGTSYLPEGIAAFILSP